MKGKEGREHAWGGGGGMQEDGVVHPSTTKEDLSFSQEGGCRVRPQDFCPGICVAQLGELGKQGLGWDAADKPLDAVWMPTGSCSSPRGLCPRRWLELECLGQWPEQESLSSSVFPSGQEVE